MASGSYDSAYFDMVYEAPAFVGECLEVAISRGEGTLLAHRLIAATSQNMWKLWEDSYDDRQNFIAQPLSAEEAADWYAAHNNSWTAI